MGKITSYPRVSKLLDNNVLIIDGAGQGTHTITAKDIAVELLKLLDSKEQVSNLKMDELDQITSMLPTDKVLVGTESGVKAMSAKNALFDVLDIDSTISLEMRKNYFRGKNLGTTFTDEQKKQIRDGTFHDLFPGDYWEKDGIRWRIVDIDYYMGHNNNEQHHLLIMPDQIICEKPLFSSNAANQKYFFSDWVNGQTKTSIWNLINDMFHLRDTDGKGRFFYPVSHFIISAYDSNNQYPLMGGDVEESLYIPTLAQIYGVGYVGNTSFNISKMVEYPDTKQFDLFRIAPKYIIGEKYISNIIYGYYLRDVADIDQTNNYTDFYCVDMGGTGLRTTTASNSSHGIRPVFGLVGTGY